MSPKRNKPRKRWFVRASTRPPSTRETSFLLDRATVGAVQRGRQIGAQVLRYHWDFYAAFQHQRSQVVDSIRKALTSAAEGPFTFERWQRVVDYRHSLQPLSSAGSVLTDPGGRFNIGDIDAAKFPTFPGLYLASDQETALLEKFGSSKEELSELDLALRNTSSYSCVAVTGEIGTVINLEHPTRLQDFFYIVGGFTVPADVAAQARSLRFPPPQLVHSVDALQKELLEPHWRAFPMRFDVPSSSQIFGQLAAEAGIEGIVYPSTKTKARCLVVFPHKLAPRSFVELADDAPAEIRHSRLDASTWHDLVS